MIAVQRKGSVMELYLVLIKQKQGYKVHSWHGDKSTAIAWMNCKVYDDEEVEIATLSKEQVIDLQSFLEKK